MGPAVVLEQGVETVEGTVAVDQVEAANAPDIPANARRISLVLQNSGNTAVTYAGNFANAAAGPGLAAEAGANQFNGGQVTIDHYTGALWIRSIAAAGEVRFIEYLRKGS